MPPLLQYQHPEPTDNRVAATGADWLMAFVIGIAYAIAGYAYARMPLDGRRSYSVDWYFWNDVMTLASGIAIAVVVTGIASAIRQRGGWNASSRLSLLVIALAAMLPALLLILPSRWMQKYLEF